MLFLEQKLQKGQRSTKVFFRTKVTKEQRGTKAFVPLCSFVTFVLKKLLF
jgi:hypothetical protein